MGGNYSHTNRADGLTLTHTIYNADHQQHIDNMTPAGLDDYSASVAQMQSQVSPGAQGTESQPTSGAGELERLRFVLARLIGQTYWYDPPKNPRTLMVNNNTAISNSTGETNLVSGTVTGGTMGNSGALEIWAHGDVVNTSGVARVVTWRLYFGTGSVRAQASISVANAAAGNYRQWQLTAKINNSGSAQNSNSSVMRVDLTSTSTGTTPNFTVTGTRQSGTRSMSVTTSGNQSLRLAAVLAAATGGLTLSCRGAYVKAISS